MTFTRSVALICAAGVLAFACGKSTPTGPTTATASVNTYVAELTLAPGVTGTLTLRASNSLASLERGDIPVLSRLLAWVEPGLAAQGSTATGLLVTSNGDVISLTGTFSGDTFSVSGFGYTIVATVTSTSTGTSISGTATLPGGGTAAVTAPPPLPVTGPPPADPLGTYTGTFRIDTAATQVNRKASDDTIVLNCSFNIVVNGQLSLRIFNVTGSGLVQSELTSSWTESGTSSMCPNVPWSNSSVPSRIAGFEGPASTLVYGRVDQFPSDTGQGTATRAESFVGAVSANTVVMKISRSFKFVNQLNTTQNGLVNAVQQYPTVSVTVTLTKQ